MALTLEGLEKWYVNTYKMKCAFAGEDVPDPIPMPDVTTIDGLLEGIAETSEDAFVAAAQSRGRYHDNEYAYILQLPGKIKKWYGIKKIGGRTVIWNQILPNGNFVDSSTWTITNSGTVSISDNTATVSATVTSYFSFRKSSGNQINLINGHKYLITAVIGSSAGKFSFIPFGSMTYGSYSSTDASTPKKHSWLYTATQTANATMEVRFQTTTSGVSETVTATVKDYMCFDITKMVGAGNEPSTAEECEAIVANKYHALNAGELISAGVTAIVSKDANNDTIETITIPAAITSLAGYGLSCPNHANYIDFEEQKYYQYVGERPYEAGDDSDTDVITDGTTTHYPLDTPVETSISLDVDNMQYANGGTITFENQYNGDYNVPVPVEVRYIA